MNRLLKQDEVAASSRWAKATNRRRDETQCRGPRRRTGELFVRGEGSPRRLPTGVDLDSALLAVTHWSTLLLLFVAPMLLGGRHPLGRLVVVALISLLAVSWIWRRYAGQDLRWHWTGLEWLIVATIGVTAFQLIPLPGASLERLSPAIAKHLSVWTESAADNLQGGPWSCISLHPQATRHGLAMFMAYALLLVVTVQRLQSVRDVERLTRWIAGSAMLMAGVGFLQLLFGNGQFLWCYDHPTRDTFGVVRGAFANQNHLAHFLALGIAPRTTPNVSRVG